MRWVAALVGMATAAGTAAPALAVTNFVQNGGFELVSLPGKGADLGASATLYDGKSSIQMSSGNGTQYVNSWFNCSTASYCGYPSGGGTAGYTMLMMNATTTSTIYTNDNNTMALWGQPNNVDDKATGAFKALSLSPNGGNFLAADGAYQSTPILQVLTGLTVGKTYDLSFSYAGAQQAGYTGATTEAWKVGWTNASDLSDSQSYTTPVLNDDSHSFTGWKAASASFKATNTSQILSFLAAGTPEGKPPFSLLDGVSVVEHVAAVSNVPEPASWATMIAGFGMVGAAMRRRRPAAAAA